VDLALPPAQDALLRAVHAANPRTVALLTSSYPYAVGWAEANVPAMLWSSHGGQEFGHAVAEVLFGDSGPAGRLTQTWYRDDADLPDLLDYDIIADDATYLYFRGTPLYPFGHGLTYADLDYTGLQLTADSMSATGTITVTVDVANRSDRDGDEVVQLYTRQRDPAVDADAYAGVTLVDADRTDGDAVLATADGGWIAFHGVAFGRGLTGCTARLSAARPGQAAILLHRRSGRRTGHREARGRRRRRPVPVGIGGRARRARRRGGRSVRGLSLGRRLPARLDVQGDLTSKGQADSRISTRRSYSAGSAVAWPPSSAAVTVSA
jgi:hypothetical protein